MLTGTPNRKLSDCAPMLVFLPFSLEPRCNSHLPTALRECLKESCRYGGPGEGFLFCWPARFLRKGCRWPAAGTRKCRRRSAGAWSKPSTLLYGRCNETNCRTLMGRKGLRSQLVLQDSNGQAAYWAPTVPLVSSSTVKVRPNSLTKFCTLSLSS